MNVFKKVRGREKELSLKLGELQQTSRVLLWELPPCQFNPYPCLHFVTSFKLPNIEIHFICSHLYKLGGVGKECGFPLWGFHNYLV